MKVIDLLNKIVNREEVPKKIKYTWFYEWSYDNTRDEYCYMQKNDDRFDNDWLIESILNDEIEIIEEDKQIKKFEINYARDIEEKIFYEESDKPNHCILGDAGTELLINKINELIENQNKIIRELKANSKQKNYKDLTVR